MTDDAFAAHLCHPDPLASRLILACLSCRDTEAGYAASRETFGTLIDDVLAEAGDCRWCVRNLIADLAWIAAQWATPAQESWLAAGLAAELDGGTG